MKPRRYEPLFELAVGGMATVYVGTARGAMGFRQIVALKKPHPHLLEDAQQRKALRHEARLASLIHHANVVDVRDVEDDGENVWLVMDYIEGASFAELLSANAKEGSALDPAITVRVILDACAGLAAAHAATSRSGEPLSIIHRDVSPQNILVGLDGVTRLTDFGIAKALDGPAATAPGTLKGKLAYMAPEYVAGSGIDARADLFALGVVLWEALAGRRLFLDADDDLTKRRVLEKEAPALDAITGPEIAAVVARALKKNRSERYSSALEMGTSLESAARALGSLAGPSDVSAVVRRFAGARIDERRDAISAVVDDAAAVSSLRPHVDVATDSTRLPERIVVMPAVTPPPRRSRIIALVIAVALAGLATGGWCALREIAR
ncbi:hypothetical protein BH09MYX1_BH09MYX1_43120 [soil metagenome]